MDPSGPPKPEPPSVSQTPTLPSFQHPPSLLLFLGLTVVVLTADLWIKAWSFAHVAPTPVVLMRQSRLDPNFAIPDHAPLVLIPGLLDLKLTFNTGAVFGLGKGQQMVFIFVSVAAVGVILWSFVHSRARSHAIHVALGLILAGASGNLYDRIRFNAVRDMFLIFPTTRLWPYIFNLADASLMVGMGVLIVTLWLHDRQLQSAATDHG